MTYGRWPNHTPALVAWFDQQVDQLERDHEAHKAAIAQTGARLDAVLAELGEG